MVEIFISENLISNFYFKNKKIKLYFHLGKLNPVSEIILILKNKSHLEN